MQNTKLSVVIASDFIVRYLQEKHSESFSMAERIGGIFKRFMKINFAFECAFINPGIQNQNNQYAEQNMKPEAVDELVNLLFNKSKELQKPKLAYYSYWI